MIATVGDPEMCIAQSADIFGAGLVAGVFFMGTFAVHPAAGRLDTVAHLRLRQELIRRLSKFMPSIMFLPVVASIGVMMLCQTSVQWVLDTLGLPLSLATIGITVAVNAPLNRRFAGWSPDALPKDWQSYVDRWNVGHSVRMATALGAFICAIFAGS
jgi:uncharacterized membrane protein